MPKHPKRPTSSLEREVISAVVILYLLISGAMLLIHHLQPAGSETTTSSKSPAHESFSAGRPGDAAPVK